LPTRIAVTIEYARLRGNTGGGCGPSGSVTRYGEGRRLWRALRAVCSFSFLAGLRTVEDELADTRQSTGHDPQQIFNNASHFAESAALLHQAGSRILSGPQPTVQLPFLIPAIVCGAFSVELFMKCLVLVEKGSFPRTHRPRTLCSRLSRQLLQAFINGLKADWTGPSSGPSA